MPHTHESCAQHIDMVLNATNVRVEEVRHHAGQRGASTEIEHLVGYSGIRNREPLLPLAVTTRWCRAAHPSKARPRPRGSVTELKRGPLATFDR